MKKTVFTFVSIMTVMFTSCKTVDVEKSMKIDLAEENKELKEQLEKANEALSVYVKEDEYEYDVEPKLIPFYKYIVIDKNEYNPDPDINKLEGVDAVKQSYKDSIVSLKDFTGGMSEFDYNENYQFPIFTRKLSMTTIILNADESMSVEDVFLSDSESWEITGDVWPSPEGSRQLIMIKPKIDGLETNMLIVTDKRLYHFVLYSTKKDYQPMVKFRYPAERKFITKNTIKAKPEKIVTSYGEADLDLVSFNYKIRVPIFQKKVDWVPNPVYDDGSFTYIQLPETVLQKEFPVIYENGRDIVNYEIHPTKHNLIIVNKLIEKLTLRVGKRKITIVKKKGEPAPLSVRR